MRGALRIVRGIAGGSLCLVVALAAAGCGGADSKRGGGGGSGSCDPQTTTIPVGDAPAMNNAATLQGAPIGLGTFENPCEVRRRVPVTVTRPAEGLTIDTQAFLLRGAPLVSAAVTAIVPLRNDGAAIVC